MDQLKQDRLKERINAEAEDQKLPCAKAFAIAAEFAVSNAEVGKICNEIDVKIVSCQLGCF